jgi:nicotinamide-nucleotide amidase
MTDCVLFGHYRERSLTLIGALSEKLMAGNMFLGTAESCTGGLIAALCTELPGSSRWFAGGIVAYADSVKSAVLGVEAAVLREHGAVSSAVVEAMAGGLLRVLPVDMSLAVSGIAGPGGGSEEKPVGMVWIAAALGRSNPRNIANGLPKGRVCSRQYYFSGNRAEVRCAAVLAALEAAADLLGM